MGVNTSLRPLPSKNFGFLEAQHLLNRAGFGGSPQQIMALQNMGLVDAVDHLVDYERIDDSMLPDPSYDADIIRPWTTEERSERQRARRASDQEALERLQKMRQQRMAEDRLQMADIERWWLARMIATPRPLQEKLTLLWHNHFATSFRAVQDSFLMLKQNVMFRKHACTSFVDLALGIVHDPAMLHYLNNTQNRKQHPNENLARELMELFTLGEGNYSESDIKEGARALTGYFVDDNDFVFEQRQHDDGGKRILGDSGAYNGDTFVQLLLRQPACSRFIARKLYRHFVADHSEGVTPAAKTVIEQLAREMLRSKYALAPVLKTLFRSQHFYDPSVTGSKIKCPAELVVGTLRVLSTPTRDLGLLTDALATMGQKLFHPPSVAGWDYGQAWINTSTLFSRQNTAAYLLTGKLPFEDGWTRERIEYNPQSLIERLPSRSPEAVVDHLLATLLGHAAGNDPTRRERLVHFARERNDPTSSDALLALLLLITAMPEYQLC